MSHSKARSTGIDIFDIAIFLIIYEGNKVIKITVFHKVLIQLKLTSPYVVHQYIVAIFGVSPISKEVIKNKDKPYYNTLKVYTISKLQSKMHEQFINVIIVCSLFSGYCMLVFSVT
jgi:hypothetical protein